jgi:hypothetical protein
MLMLSSELRINKISLKTWYRQLDLFLVRKQMMKHSITSSISYTTLNTENTDVESWRNLVCWLVK